jgi:hypothetical protein
MSRRSANLRDRKATQLGRGEPWVVHPAEVAKSTAAYQTDREILLACIIVSGTLDTAIVLRADMRLAHGIAITDDERISYDAFRRVWQFPTEREHASVLMWAAKIAAATGNRHGDALRWSKPT